MFFECDLKRMLTFYLKYLINNEGRGTKYGAYKWNNKNGKKKERMQMVINEMFDAFAKQVGLE